MAHEIPGTTITRVANAVLTQYKCVKLANTGRAVAIAATTDRPIGILQDKTPSAALSDGTFGAVTIMCDGISKLLAGTGGLAVGDLVGVDGDGDGVVVALNSTSTYVAATSSLYVIGQCIGAAVAGGLATVLFSTMNPPRNQ